jgi:hypothetical protein
MNGNREARSRRPLQRGRPGERKYLRRLGLAQPIQGSFESIDEVRAVINVQSPHTDILNVLRMAEDRIAQELANPDR